MAKTIKTTVVGGYDSQTYNVEIVRGESIRLFGGSRGEAFDRTYRIGDHAEYHSYNFSYHGPIVSIGEKTVTIAEPYRDAKKHRLSLERFCWRNWDWSLEYAREQYANWSD